MKVLDLFSGIGGFSLGLERAGMETIAFCEIDKDCRSIIKSHWFGIPIFRDVVKLNIEKLKEAGIEEINVICGGFPCQDISSLGLCDGINGKRSGLWSEFKRLISELRPQYAIMENVSNLLRGDGGTWFGKFLSDLAEIGYDAEWDIISAANLGANHNRERVWITAYPQGNTTQDSIHQRIPQDIFFKGQPRGNTWSPVSGTYWETDQPGFFEMDDGISSWVASVKGYGNAVVPQIPELIGRAIMSIR